MHVVEPTLYCSRSFFDSATIVNTTFFVPIVITRWQKCRGSWGNWCTWVGLGGGWFTEESESCWVA